jgi:hypothetical protein
LERSGSRGIHVSHGRKPVEIRYAKAIEPPEGAIHARTSCVIPTDAADRIEFRDA